MTMLQTHGLNASYGQFQALFGIDMHIDAGETIAIIGANGAGKSTLMRALCGLIPSPAGAITLQGRPIGHLPSHRVVKAGVTMVPEGRKLFASLSVEENLKIGADAFPKGGYWNLARLYEMFPMLEERKRLPAASLSGGQQQIAAIGRALLSNPKVLLCDEISLGLAPLIVKQIYAALPLIAQSGCCIAVVEQDIRQALSVASRVYCMMEGRITLHAKPAGLTREAIHAAYFGTRA
jgi:branched-chain amino acid transport system ATP-binding protein